MAKRTSGKVKAKKSVGTVTARKPSPAVPAKKKTSGVLVTLLVVGLIVYIGVVVAIRMLLGEGFRDSTLAAACWITGCSSAGLAFLGWLMITTLPLVIIASIFAVRRYGRRGGIGATIAGLVYFAVAMCWVSGRDGPELADMLRGPGAEPFAQGVGWGYGTLALMGGLSLVAGFVSSKVSMPPWISFAVIGVAALGMATAAMVRAVPAYPPAVTMIGPSTTIDDDVLTRTSATERNGCDGILADSGPLDECLRTAEFEVTTSDSDAMVRFSAVMFADNDAAWEAWRDIRETAPAAGIDGDTLVIGDVTSEWLTVGVVRHADGRKIAEADKPWLRWPVAQLRYVFAQAIGYSIAAEPKPDEEAAPKS